MLLSCRRQGLDSILFFPSILRSEFCLAAIDSAIASSVSLLSLLLPECLLFLLEEDFFSPSFSFEGDRLFFFALKIC
jgi:hypothetical protein